MSNRGITLIEVMIAMAIAVLLISLAMPAIEATREASRRVQCAEHLRQISLGLQYYHNQAGKLPPAMIWSPGGEPLGKGIVPPGTIDRVSLGIAPRQAPDRLFSNWVIAILPHIEEREVFDSIDVKKPIDDPTNRTARSTDLAILKCPSDGWNGPDNHFQRAGLSSADEGYARGNYALNSGTNESCLMRLGKGSLPGSCLDGYQVDGNDLERDTRQVWGSGIGGVNKRFSFAEFPNGLSNTVAIEEVRAGVHPLDRRGVWSLGFPGSSVTAGHGIKGNRGPNSDNDLIQGCSEVIAAVPDLAAIGMACGRSSDPREEFSERATARSLHRGGVNVVMADGSLHFVQDTIDPQVWHQMHKRDNSTPVDLPF